MSVYEIPFLTANGEATTLECFKDRLLVVVNTASRCGLTPQYAGLQQLQERYGEQGLSVVGFPCNQFSGQEPGTDAEIQEFCSTTFGLDFPVFAKIDVNGESRHPLYAELTRAADPDGESGDVQWNFEKFLISPAGEVVARIRPQVEPTDPRVIELIERFVPGATVTAS